MTLVLRILAIALFGVAVTLLAGVFVHPHGPTLQDRAEFPPRSLDEWPPLSDEISIETAAQAGERRARLLRLAFGRPVLPTRLPIVEQGWQDPDFASELVNLERVDRLTIALPYDFAAVAYLVLPARSNGRLLVYHNGHDRDFLDGKPVVAYFLERGYSVLVFWMPLMEPNTNPTTLTTPTCGRVVIESEDHDVLACMPRPLRYFVEPVAVGLNYTDTLGYDGAAMVGLSGGGWTTVVHAALDPRVRHSYPVAGSLPFHVSIRTCERRSPEECFGDFEQRMADLYRLANYLELYVLGAWGPDRKQISFFNVNDPCCFSGRSYRQWTPAVQQAVRRLGSGAFVTIGDTTHDEHVISPFALEAIHRALRYDEEEIANRDRAD